VLVTSSVAKSSSSRTAWKVRESLTAPAIIHSFLPVPTDAAAAASARKNAAEARLVGECAVLWSKAHEQVQLVNKKGLYTH
jgi:hypothetical protein